MEWWQALHPRRAASSCHPTYRHPSIVDGGRCTRNDEKGKKRQCYRTVVRKVGKKGPAEEDERSRVGSSPSLFEVIILRSRRRPVRQTRSASSTSGPRTRAARRLELCLDKTSPGLCNGGRGKQGWQVANSSSVVSTLDARGT